MRLALRCYNSYVSKRFKLVLSSDPRYEEQDVAKMVVEAVQVRDIGKRWLEASRRRVN